MLWGHIAGFTQTFQHVGTEVELVKRNSKLISSLRLVLLDVVETNALNVTDGNRILGNIEFGGLASIFGTNLRVLQNIICKDIYLHSSSLARR